MLQRATAALIAVLLWSVWTTAQQPPDSVRQAPASTPQINTEAALHGTALGAVPAVAQFEGRNLTSITFRGIHQDARVVEHLKQIVTENVGPQLDRDNLRRAMQRLFATGRFMNLQAEASADGPTGVSLTFVAQENFFVGAVNVMGAPKRPPANQLINATKLQLGELFDAVKFDEAMRSMKTVLADNGYYKAEITSNQNFRPDWQVADLNFYVKPGPLARVGQIIVRGNPGMSDAEVLSIAKLHGGEHVYQPDITRALVRLRKHFQKDGRLEAQVALVERNFHPQTNRLDYVFRIDRGPVVDITVDGAKVRQGLLRKYVPVYEENAVDNDLLNEGRRNLRDYFQTKGYFDAQVDFERRKNNDEDRVHVIYTVQRGARHTLNAVQITGNKYFDREALIERMVVKPASGMMTHGRYSQSLLAHDVAAIENLYKANGFEQVKVVSEVVNEDSGPGHMVVKLRVEEGPQTRVRSLKIVGNKAYATERLLPLLTTVDGQPFSELNVATDRDSIINFYFNRGFPDVDLETTANAVPQHPTQMDVTYTIREGEQVFVNRVLAFGNVFTRPYVIRRTFQLHDGEPLSQIEMQNTQRALYNLGLFNEVDVAVQNPEGKSRYKDVLFEMREARRWTFTYGLGLEIQTGGAPTNLQINTEPGPGVPVPPNSTPPVSNVVQSPDTAPTISPRVSFEVTRLNFRGRDHTLAFKTHVGRLQQRATMTYDAPHWFDRPNLRLTFTTFYDNSRDVRTFTAQRIEGSVQAEQCFGGCERLRPTVNTLLYRLQYRRVSVDAASLAISPDLVPLLSRPVRVGMPSVTFVHDKRDDPLETHRGNYLTFDTGVAAKAFGSQTNFAKFLVQNSTYWPFGKRSRDREWVLARMTRIGVEEPFSTGSSFSQAGVNPVPLPERFFGGGGNSHRGFALNQAGPRDLTTGFPIGGNAIFVNSVELRTPSGVVPFGGDNLSMVFFYDMGNVFETGQDMVKSFGRWSQKNKSLCANEATHTLCNFNYMSSAVGLGARYRTPIGPVRFDLSYNLNPPAFGYFVQCATIPTDSKGVPQEITGPCGNSGPGPHYPAGTQLFQTGTLRKFNFFFSIGQTF